MLARHIRGLVLAMSGKELKSHLPGELLQHGSRYVPELKELFDDGMGKLEKAYSSGRYSLHYRINREDIQALMAQVEALQERVKEMFEAAMMSYRQAVIPAAATGQRMQLFL